jgi:DNA-binding NtrC family response regulator
MVPLSARRILLVDVDARFADALRTVLPTRVRVAVCRHAAHAPARVEEDGTDLVLHDVDTLDPTAIAALARRCPDVPVLAIGRTRDPVVVSRALGAGATSFCSKHLPLSELAAMVEDAIERSPGSSPSRPAVASQVRRRGSIVYRSPAMVTVLERIERFGRSDLPVLITGETGTGKDLVARLIHDLRRSAGRFEAVNVTALPDALFERELFGHERGAFTGAVDARPGLLELCDGGTLFLDEIGNLSLERQATLLRIMEDGRIRRLGGEADRAVDVRFVLATNEDLARARDQGRFRRDLWYRIARLHVHLPPLRARGHDVVDIALSLVGARDDGPCGLDADARGLIQEHRWPGNVRELEGVLEAACLLDDDGVIGVDDLHRAGLPPARAMRSRGAPPRLVRRLPATELLPIETASERVLRDLRAQAVEAALILAEGEKKRAAELLGVGRQTLYTWMQELGYRPGESGAGT